MNLCECGHHTEEHQPGCTAILRDEGDYRRYCLCTHHQPDEQEHA